MKIITRKTQKHKTHKNAFVLVSMTKTCFLLRVFVSVLTLCACVLRVGVFLFACVLSFALCVRGCVRVLLGVFCFVFGTGPFGFASFPARPRYQLCRMYSYMSTVGFASTRRLSGMYVLRSILVLFSCVRIPRFLRNSKALTL